MNSDELEQPGGAAPAVRRRRAQRRRRQPRRPARRARAAHRRADHDRRQGDPGARRPPRRVGVELVEAFRRTVAAFEGSVAIGAAAADEPGRLLLALNGSGQGVYVGLAEDRYIVASEPYGVVEETARYVRLDGEHGGQVRRPRRRRSPARSRACERARLRRLRAAGRPTPTSRTAEVTTRDIDRGDCPHFLLKEITEAPDSLAQDAARQDRRARRAAARRRRRRGRCRRTIAARLADGSITRIRVIGQGTAAVAGQSMAAVLDELRRRRARRRRRHGHRAVGLRAAPGHDATRSPSPSARAARRPTRTAPSTCCAAAARPCSAIVNRRSSDLTDKADGVLYTSDGRDVEMSVASTKAFYAQVAAGVAAGVRDQRGGRRRHRPAPPRAARRRCASCPTRCARCSAAAT